MQALSCVQELLRDIGAVIGPTATMATDAVWLRYAEVFRVRRWAA